MTNREKIELQREAYASALYNTGRYGKQESNEHAARQYPMPLVRSALIAQTTQGQYKIEHGKVYHRMNVSRDWLLTGFTPCDLKTLGLIAQEPSTEIEEE